jgi:sugar (pentulose or hexulose) kinase
MMYLGLDIGTTGVKALLVNEEGKILGKGYAGYQLYTNGSHVEQDPLDWFNKSGQAIRQAIEGFDANHISALSLSTQGSSLVAIDQENIPIGMALTWMDSRASNEASEIENVLGDKYIYKKTGWRINPTLDCSKIMYMKRSQKYKKAAKFLSTLEYMNLRLTNNPICDPSNASIRQLYQIDKLDYDDSILDVIGVSRSELPEILPTGCLVGHLNRQSAITTGLKEGMPVYNGAHDQYCASIGSGAIHKGDLLLSGGTTWVIMAINDKPLFTDTYIAPGAHPITGLYGAIASLVGSGTSMQWFKNNFTDESFEQIDLIASQRSEQTRNLFFYPYLSGAHYPYWIQNAKGAFTGISLEHDRYDFARAIMDSAAIGVSTALDDFSVNGCKINSLKVLGGAAKSKLWCNLISATTKTPVEILQESDACALGAAMIAATGDQAYATLAEASLNMSTRNVTCIKPDSHLCQLMHQKNDNYKRMWDSLSRYYK